MKIEPYVRFAMNHTWLKGYYINRNMWDNEFIFIDEGKLKITINGKTYHVKKNDLVVLRPKERTIIEWDNENCLQPHVHFDFVDYEDKEKVNISMIGIEDMTPEQLTYFRSDFFSDNKIKIPSVIHLKEPLLVRNVLYQIINEYNYKKDKNDLVLQGLMIQLIGLVLRENSSSEITEETSSELDRTIIFMNEHLDSNLTLDDFASNLKISKWSLIQLFNRKYSTSPMKYYNSLRHLRAKDLIMYSPAPINKISEEMGFNEPQTFSRWFKNIDGNFPTYYRRRNNK